MIKKIDFKRYWVEAAIGAAGTIAGAAASAAGQSSLNKKTREFNKEEAEKQRQWSEKIYNSANAWNYERWLEEQQYNNPTNQLQRLRDAGLNPMYYGLDGSSAGDLSAAQPLGYERADMGNQVNPLSSFADAGLKVAQVANIQADTAKKQNESLTEVQRREKMLADIDNAKQELVNMKLQAGLTESQKSEIDKRISWIDRINEATLNEKESVAKLNEANRNRIESLVEGEKLLQSKSIEDFEHKWKKIAAEIAKMSKETGLLQKDIENYALNHASNGFLGTGLSGQNLIRLLRGANLSPRSGLENNFGEGTDWRDLANSGQ